MVTDSTCSITDSTKRVLDKRGSEKGLGKGVLEQKGLEKGVRKDQKGQKVFLANTFGRIIKFDVVPAAQTLARRYFAPKTSVA